MSFPITDTYKKDIQSLRTLIDSDIMNSGSPAFIDNMKCRLETTYEKALEQVHHNKLFQCSDGRWKTKNPQIIKKTRLELLEALYEHYFGSKNTIADLFQKWIEEVKQDAERGHKSILTYERYNSDWNRFYKNSELASMNISDVKASHIKNHYKNLSANAAITRKTLNNAKSILNHIFDYAFDRDLVSSNIARSISTRDIHCKDVNNESKVYTNEERALIITQAAKENDVFARAIILMFCSCTRIGEIKALKWEDIDFNKETIYIHREIVRRKDKDGHEYFVCVDHTKTGLKEGNRVQPLSERAIAVLKAQRQENPFGEHVFLYKGEPLNSNTINHHLKHICERASVNYMSSHKIRFWAVTTMYDNNMSPAIIQRMAGHADPSTTDHYKRVSRLGNVDTDNWNSMFG